MKILYVIEGALPYGSNRSLIALIGNLREMGVEVFVVGKKGAMQTWVKVAGARFFPAYISFLVWPRSDTRVRKLLYPVFVAGRVGMNLLSLPRLLALCRKIRPDVIHTNIGPVSAGYYVARWLGIKHVWHLREFQDIGFGMKFFPSKAAYLRRLSRSDAVVCVSKAVARHFGQPYSSVSYDGVASREYVPSTEEKERSFLFVANLQPTKDVELVIVAYLQFIARTALDYKLLVVGGGDSAYIQKIELLAGEHIDNGNVKFLGYRDDVPALMRKAKAVIVACEHEAFGRVAAEAMFNGCIVIGRNTAGTVELLDPWLGSEVGLLFSDVASLIERMICIAVMQDDRYRSIAINAQRKAIACFSLEGYTAHILSIYERLIPPSKDGK